MNRVVKTVTNNLKKISVEDLRKIKELVLNEISNRQLSEEGKGTFCRLYSILKRIYGRYLYEYNYENWLSKISEMTEEEFCKYSGVGKSVLQAAKIELTKRNLSFKENKILET